ncbi:uncharacterized protein DDB_G0284459-like [Ornithodoros turicata]|uniref:uncharacterized protein DDB_G0284459-like n=1 Tax=Ornithodoros turicata TaxID=34597 RepID=UPI003139D0F7
MMDGAKTATKNKVKKRLPKAVVKAQEGIDSPSHGNDAVKRKRPSKQAADDDGEKGKMNGPITKKRKVQKLHSNAVAQPKVDSASQGGDNVKTNQAVKRAFPQEGKESVTTGQLKKLKLKQKKKTDEEKRDGVKPGVQAKHKKTVHNPETEDLGNSDKIKQPEHKKKPRKPERESQVNSEKTKRTNPKLRTEKQRFVHSDGAASQSNGDRTEELKPEMQANEENLARSPHENEETSSNKTKQSKRKKQAQKSKRESQVDSEKMKPTKPKLHIKKQRFVRSDGTAYQSDSDRTEQLEPETQANVQTFPCSAHENEETSSDKTKYKKQAQKPERERDVNSAKAKQTKAKMHFKRQRFVRSDGTAYQSDSDGTEQLKPKMQVNEENCTHSPCENEGTSSNKTKQPKHEQQTRKPKVAHIPDREDQCTSDKTGEVNHKFHTKKHVHPNPEMQANTENIAHEPYGKEETGSYKTKLARPRRQKGRKKIIPVKERVASKEPSLLYLHAFGTPVWKFCKKKQYWLIENAFDEDSLGEDDFQLFLQYIENMRGVARQELQVLANNLVNRYSSSKDGASAKQYERARSVIQMLAE